MLCETEGKSMGLDQKLLAYIGGLIELGNTMLPPDEYSYRYSIGSREFNRFQTSCLHLIALLGSHAAPWVSSLQAEGDTIYCVEAMLGALESISFAITSGLLVKVETLVASQVFGDMLEQAEYLFDKKFDRAAAVLARGVLEEHLRRWCQFAGFTSESPQISGYNTALYKGAKYDKIAMKRIEWLATVGNNAAHNLEVKTEDVKRMLEDVPRFLDQYPIA